MAGATVLSRWSDRLNPILVKEVRQSLRGRYFMVMFWLTLAVATVIGSIMLVVQGEEPSNNAGITFFLAMYACLSVAVHLFVPFGAFLSLGSEWDENTHDLLVLSDLKPRQIVLGKLLSAAIQVLLYYSAFGPFLVFSFLLKGLDLRGAAWALGFTLVTALVASTGAICLSSLSRTKYLRVFLLALLAIALCGASAGAGFMWGGLLFELDAIHSPDFPTAMMASMTGLLAVAAFAFAFAVTRLAHPEENRSTGLRVLTSIVMVAGVGWATWTYEQFREPAVMFVFGMVLFTMLTFMSTFFMSEEEKLGRRVRLQVPRNPLLAALSAPYLPGGGRGVLFFVVNAVFVLGSLFFLLSFITPSSHVPVEFARTFLLICALYAFLYVGVPTFLFSFASRKLASRIAARICVPIFAFGLAFLPTIIGYFAGWRSLARARHVGNPGWLLEEMVFDLMHAGAVTTGIGSTSAVSAGSAATLGMGALAMTVLGVLAINAFRAVAGVKEALHWSAYRGRLHGSPGRAGADPEPGPDDPNALAES